MRDITSSPLACVCVCVCASERPETKDQIVTNPSELIDHRWVKQVRKFSKLGSFATEPLTC